MFSIIVTVLFVIKVEDVLTFLIILGDYFTSQNKIGHVLPKRGRIVRAGLRGGATGAISPAPRRKRAPRDEIYLFQTKYSFEKFRNSEAIKEYNFILYSYVALSIKGTRAPNSN